MKTLDGATTVPSASPDGADDVYAVHEPRTGTYIANGYVSRAETP